MMDGHMFDGIGNLIVCLCWVCAISVPLGLWKLIEIVIWLCRHVSISW
jgi:hypothetical protein